MACYTKPFNLCPQGVINSKCVVYTGSNLTTIGVSTNDRLDVILQSINEAVGDFDFNLFIEDTDSINLSGNGTSSSPLTANLNISASTGNLVQLLADGVFVEDITEDVTYIVNNVINNVVYDTFDGTFLIDGGEISWVVDYTYLVSAANYVILGDTYASPETQIILDPADGTFDRIDLVVLDTNGDVIVITGTPALNPQEPSFDPQTQIPLQFITVVAATTVDPCAVDTPIYTDNLGTGGGEWDAVSSSGTINVNSTNFPQTGTKDIEATNAAINATVTFTPAAPLSLSTYTQLNFYIRSKGTWIGNNPNNSKRLVVTFFNGATQVGNGVLILGTGNYGFNSATTGVYQQISIPKANFNITNETVTSLTMRVSGNQGTMGFYLDNVSLETNCNSTPPGPSAFTLNTLSTDTITLSATGSGTSSNPLTASLIVGPTDNTEQNFMMWDGDSVELRTLASLGIISGITADNGLTANTATNVQLGGTLLQDTSISTTSLYHLAISGSKPSGGILRVTQSATGGGDHAITGVAAGAATGISGNSTSGTGILGTTTSGTGGVFSSITGPGFSATSAGTHAGTFIRFSNTDNDILSVLRVIRETNLTSLVGMGASIDFLLEPTTGGDQISSQIVSKWVDPTAATRSANFEVWNTNNAVSERKLSISNLGAVILDDYGVGSFTTGTPIYNLSVTATGQVIETLPGAGGEIISADNGLTENTPGNVQLGGTLINATTTVAAGTNVMQFTTTNGGLFEYSFGTFTASNTANAFAINAITTDGIAGVFDVNPASTNTIVNSLSIRRFTSGTAANNIGVGLQFVIENSVGSTINSNQLVSQLTNVTSGSETSRFILRGVNNSVSVDALTILGSGSTRLNSYGAGTFTGTATFNLAVDASGNVIEVAAGGGTNLYNTDGTLTGNRTITLSGNTLRALEATEEFFLVDPTTGSEVVLLQAINTTGANNVAAYNGLTTATDATVFITTNFNGTNIGKVQTFSDTTGSLNTYTATDHEFIGDVAINGTYRLKLGSNAGDLGTPSNGELFYNSTTNKFRAYENGAWVDMIASGNVTKVGTPVDNQVGVWTGDGTIEGTSGLTYDGQLLTVTGSTPRLIASSSQVGGEKAALLTGSSASIFSFSNTGVFGIQQDANPSTTIGTNGYSLITYNTTYNTLLGSNMAIGQTDIAAQLGIITTAAKVGLKIRGAASQTANLQEWQNSTPSALSVVDSSGKFGIANVAPSALLTLGTAGTTAGTLSLAGATSGTATINVPTTAGTPTLTLPTVTGTIVQYVEGTTASSATPTPTGDARENYYDVTALAVNATFGAPTGTASNHNGLLIRVKDDGTARTLAFNAIYRAGTDIALPTTTVISKTMYIQFVYNSADTKWDLVGLTQGF